MKIFNKPHCMVDIETLSTKQTAAPISIGAVQFDFKTGIGKKFTVNIDKESAFTYNLDIEKSTLQWWASQPKEIWHSVTKDAVPLEDALHTFNNWLLNTYGNTKDLYVWANGAVFDFGILRNCYEVTKIKRPWEYWNEMDLRTLSNTLDVRLSSGNNHSALDDAVNQAEQLIKILGE